MNEDDRLHEVAKEMLAQCNQVKANITSSIEILCSLVTDKDFEEICYRQHDDFAETLSALIKIRAKVPIPDWNLDWYSKEETPGILPSVSPSP